MNFTVFDINGPNIFAGNSNLFYFNRMGYDVKGLVAALIYDESTLVVASEHGRLITFYNIIYPSKETPYIYKRFTYSFYFGAGITKLLKIDYFESSVVALFSDNTVLNIDIHEQ